MRSASGDALLVSGSSPADEATVGGKAANLARLAAAGLPVPPWFAVTTAAFDVVCGPLVPSAPVPEDRAAIRDLSRALREKVRAATLPAEVREALARVEGRVAVRSSAVGEDSAQDSFAGQLDTFLHVAREDVAGRVLDCLGSAFSERAIAYRAKRGLAAAKAAVIVQAMVDARVAGVAFTANPTTQDRSEAVVAAGLGLGEGVVAGTVESDTYFADLATGAVRDRVLARKRSRVAPVAGGTAIEPVSPEEGDRPALTDAEVSEVVALARRVQELYGTPQDIEWAYDRAGKLWLLQARPITTLDAGPESIFDSANVVESFPGLSMPLTFSFARRAYEVIFRQGARLFGVGEATLARFESVHANLLAYVDGRIYYNILNWYRLFQMFPGFDWAQPAWEKALGLARRYARPARVPFLTRLKAQLRMVPRMLRHFFAVERTAAAFLEDMRRVLDAGGRGLDSLEAHALLERLEASMRLAPGYAISTINDAFTQQLHELVTRLIARWRLGDPSELRNALLCGGEAMESVAPVRSILALASAIRRDPALRAVFESEEPLAKLDAFPEFRRALDEHLARYGDRTLHELKFETPSAGEDPRFLVTMLRNYLAGGQDERALEARERAIRREAEAAVAAKLRWRPLRRAFFGWALRRLREGVATRENLRLARTRFMGLAKRIYRALGARLAEAKLLDAPGDVLYLTTEEVAGAVRGHSVTRDLRALVQLRRRELADAASRRPAPRVAVRGIVQAAAIPQATPSTEGALEGIGCSAGRVTAPAKVVRDPGEDLTIKGEILVAPMTDPGWVFLMVAASGLVSERGSPLSHTAIIGRELGIPTVVGVAGATELIESGRRVTLDGAAGTVTLEP